MTVPSPPARLASGTGYTLRATWSAGAGWALAVTHGDVPVLASAGPVRIEVAGGPAAGPVRRHAAGYDTVSVRAGRLVCAAQAQVAEAGFQVADVFSWHDGALVLRREITVRGTMDAGFASAFGWTGPAAAPAAAPAPDQTPEPADPAAEPLWLLPGCVYGRNADAPPGAIGADIGRAPVLVRDDRLALPFAARFDPVSGATAMLVRDTAWAGAATSGGTAGPPGAPGTVTGDDLAGQLTAAGLGFGSFGDLSQDQLGFCFPGSEGAVSYPPMWTAGIGNPPSSSPVNPFPELAGPPARHWAHRYHPLTDGFTQHYQLCTVLGQAGSFAGFVRSAWRAAWYRRPPSPAECDLDTVQRVSLDLLAATVRRDPGPPAGPMPAGIPTWLDVFTGQPGPLQDTFSIGSVGRNLEVAAVLLQAAHRQGRPEWEHAARDIIGFWVDRSGTGLCHTEWDRAGRCWTDPLADTKPGAVFLRDQSEARLAVLDALDSVRSRGQDEPGWLAWCTGYARWLAQHAGPDGSLHRAYYLDGQVAHDAVNDGIHAATFLARLARSTGDQGYLALAERIAGYAWANFHSAGRFLGGTLENPNCCDREAASIALQAYLTLHAATGRSRWRRAAQLAGDFCATWVLGWDIPMGAADAPAQPCYDQTAPSAGLAVVTLGFSAVDTYLSRHVGDFLYLAELTGDAHYRDVGTLLLHNTKQMVQLGTEFGYQAPGFQIEHWAIGRGRGYGLNSGWLPWVSTAHVLGIWAAAKMQPSRS